jgi:hypothetical protein
MNRDGIWGQRRYVRFLTGRVHCDGMSAKY